MPPEEFEDFEGMSKEEFQNWLYEHREIVGDIFGEVTEYYLESDSDAGVAFSNGNYSVAMNGYKPQVFAKLVGGWQLYTQ